MNFNRPTHPAAHTVELVTIRPHEDSVAERARRELPILLNQIAAEAPGVSLRLDVSCTAGGEVRAAVTAHGDDDAAAALTEIAPVLEQAAETHIGAPTPPLDEAAQMADAVWPIALSTRHGLGFQIGSGAQAPQRWHASAKEQARSAAVPVLAELVAPCPGHSVHVSVVSAEAGTDPRWQVQMWVRAEKSSPSMRLRAAVKQLWSGLEISATPTTSDAVPALEVDVNSLASLFAIPVAGSRPIAGMIAGSAPTIPVTPTRAHTRDGEATIRLGVASTLGGGTKPIALSAHERLRHTHVLGRTGTGKSSLLAALAQGVAAAGEGMLVLDPHGTLVDRIAAELPDSAASRTWLIRSGDLDCPVPLNPLAVEDPAARDLAIDEVCSMFQHLFDKAETGIVGPRFRERVAMGLRALGEVQGPRASILDVPLILNDEKLLLKISENTSNTRLKAWVGNEITSKRSQEHGELVSWVNSKFEGFSATPAIRGILGSGVDSFDMADAMDENKIILVDLSKGTLGDSASRLLAFLHLNRAWTGGLRRRGNSPFTVMVDEAHSVTAGALTTMLSEGRKFGLAVVLAHQFLSQLNEDLRPAVDGNVATTIAFRSGATDAGPVCSRFAGLVAPPTLLTLPDLSAVIMRGAAGSMAYPHTLTVDHNEGGITRARAEAAEFSARLIAGTESALAMPHRDKTLPARDGQSGIDEALSHSERIAPSSRSRAPGESSFLDEWLAKRKAAQSAATQTSSVPDESGVSMSSM